MAYAKEKDLAINLRKKGMSYSQIRERVSVSKSTLSLWLENYPLKKERLTELRERNPKRIESFRLTMEKKRNARIQVQEEKAIKALGGITDRELFVAGFFIFWGEGSKGRTSEVCLANTDPIMIRFFLRWLSLLGAKKESIRFTLHLYADMNVQKELKFWSQVLGYPLSAFRKPQIKQTQQSEITYKNGFGHGTCNVRCMSQDLNDYVRMGLKYLRHLYE